MKLILVLILTFISIGCSEDLTSNEINRAIKACEHNEGLNLIRPAIPFVDPAVICNNHFVFRLKDTK